MLSPLQPPLSPSVLCRRQLPSRCHGTAVMPHGNGAAWCKHSPIPGPHGTAPCPHTTLCVTGEHQLSHFCSLPCWVLLYVFLFSPDKTLRSGLLPVSITRLQQGCAHSIGPSLLDQ